MTVSVRAVSGTSPYDGVSRFRGFRALEEAEDASKPDVDNFVHVITSDDEWGDRVECSEPEKSNRYLLNQIDGIENFRNRRVKNSVRREF